ncbi:hypothetical protein U1Q18_051600 [Sarracenia purpurea var. burkii]
MFRIPQRFGSQMADGEGNEVAKLVGCIDKYVRTFKLYQRRSTESIPKTVNLISTLTCVPYLHKDLLRVSNIAKNSTVGIGFKATKLAYKKEEDENMKFWLP